MADLEKARAAALERVTQTPSMLGGGLEDIVETLGIFIDGSACLSEEDAAYIAVIELELLYLIRLKTG